MTTRDYTRSDAVLDFCRVPRTRADIEDHFGCDRTYRFAVYNLVKSGKLVNLHAECASSRRPGMFVVADQAARADVMQAAGMDFSAMSAFWGRAAC